MHVKKFLHQCYNVRATDSSSIEWTRSCHGQNFGRRFSASWWNWCTVQGGPKSKPD